jgi:Kdo2-lipid IVA lauroyltransferase/acyltransferase
VSGHPGVWFMRLLAPWPLPWLRGLGRLVGWLLYVLAVPRRRVAQVNLALCFPGWSASRRRAVARENFVRFAQAWFDRAWLWHGDPARVRRRLVITGATDALIAPGPVIVFAPHFYGLDAGWTALTQQVSRDFISIYTPQPVPAVDAWIRNGRERFGSPRLFFRGDGARPVVSALRGGSVLYLLPDMNFGPQESVFVPFYGVAAATVPSLSRFARLGQARVVPVVARMTRSGYEVEVHAAWANFPTDDVLGDTARMNRELQSWVDARPDEYYWVHKRFKTRPAGQPAVY